jgi:hypothetical protein
VCVCVCVCVIRAQATARNQGTETSKFVAEIERAQQIREIIISIGK